MAGSIDPRRMLWTRLGWLGAGVFMGLAMAVAIQLVRAPKPGAENDRFRSEVSELTEELEQLTYRREEIQEHFLKSQAFIGLLLRDPKQRELLLVAGFPQKFKPQWFLPHEAAVTRDPLWFRDELRSQDAITEKDFPRWFSPGLAQERDAPWWGARVRSVPWRKTHKWQVVEARTTDTFSVRSRVWRIRCRLASLSKLAVGQAVPFQARLKIVVRSPDRGVEDLVDPYVDRFVGTGCLDPFVVAPAGRFYLEISSPGDPAEVSVEEPGEVDVPK